MNRFKTAQLSLLLHHKKKNISGLKWSHTCAAVRCEVLLQLWGTRGPESCAQTLSCTLRLLRIIYAREDTAASDWLELGGREESSCDLIGAQRWRSAPPTSVSQPSASSHHERVRFLSSARGCRNIKICYNSYEQFLSGKAKTHKSNGKKTESK